MRMSKAPRTPKPGSRTVSSWIGGGFVGDGDAVEEVEDTVEEG